MENLDTDVTPNVFDDDNFNINYLREFGEMAIVKKTNKIQSKLSNKGIPCMYLGKTPNSGKDVSRFLNIKTNRVLNSRDVVYLNEMLCDYEVRVTSSDVENVENDENDDVDEKLVDVEIVENADNYEKPANVENVKDVEDYAKPSDVKNAAKNENNSSTVVNKNDSASRTRSGKSYSIDNEGKLLGELAMFAKNNIMQKKLITPIIDVPEKFEEAWNHIYSDKRNKQL